MSIAACMGIQIQEIQIDGPKSLLNDKLICLTGEKNSDEIFESLRSVDKGAFLHVIKRWLLQL